MNVSQSHKVKHHPKFFYERPDPISVYGPMTNSLNNFFKADMIQFP